METMNVLARTSFAESVFSANEIALRCFDLYRDQPNEGLPQQIDYLVHFRMLLNDLLKNSDSLQEVRDFLEMDDEDIFDQALTIRIQKILNHFKSE